MAATELQQMIDVVAKDKGIDPSIVIGAIEDAYLAASRKVFKGDEDLRTRFNLETGQVELYAVRQIVAEVDQRRARDLARARRRSSTAKKPKSGWKSSSRRKPRSSAASRRRRPSRSSRSACAKPSARRFTASSASASAKSSTPRSSASRAATSSRKSAASKRQIPRKEQSRAENYAIGDRVRAVIKAVTKNAKGPQVVLSRTDPALLVKLFEQEVPEIYDGTVMIRGAVREAGDRAKVAVFSRERDVDPVGACVGMRGTRVQAIIRELRGEKIDIVEWSEDSGAVRDQGALSPARVQRVSIVDDEAARDGSGRRGSAAVARHRQEGPERAARGQAHRLEDRHQERRRQAQGSRAAAGGHRLRRRRASEAARRCTLPDIHDEVRRGAARGRLRHGREDPRGRRRAAGARCRASTRTRSTPSLAAARSEQARRAAPTNAGRSRRVGDEPTPADDEDADRAETSSQSKERIWPLSGSTKSPNCWVCRARKR